MCVLSSTHSFLILLIEVEREMKRIYAQGVVFDEESILGMCFTIFKESCLCFDKTMPKAELIMSKAELIKSIELRKKMSLHVLPELLQGTRNGVLSRRQDIAPEFRREHLTTQHANMTRNWED